MLKTIIKFLKLLFILFPESKATKQPLYLDFLPSPCHTKFFTHSLSLSLSIIHALSMLSNPFTHPKASISIEVSNLIIDEK